MFLNEISVDDIRPVHPEWYNEIYAIHRHGFRWMSWVGTPIKGTDGYPKKMRVRQLMSPSQLENPTWQKFLKDNDGREADGSEPLSYDYCSSNCSVAMTPDLIDDDLAVDLSRCAKKFRGSRDLGKRLAAVVREHLARALEKSEADGEAD